jgi:hypothetical protein
VAAGRLRGPSAAHLAARPSPGGGPQGAARVAGAEELSPGRSAEAQRAPPSLALPQVCGSAHLNVHMLECSKCLRGFHLSCLRPRLKAVPKVGAGGRGLGAEPARTRRTLRGSGGGSWSTHPARLQRPSWASRRQPHHAPTVPPQVDWFCPDCEAGRQAPPPRQLATAWQKLLYGTDLLQLWRITGLVRNRVGDGEVEFTGLKYARPEDTYLGRQVGGRGGGGVGGAWGGGGGRWRRACSWLSAAAVPGAAGAPKVRVVRVPRARFGRVWAPPQPQLPGAAPARPLQPSGPAHSLPGQPPHARPHLRPYPAPPPRVRPCRRRSTTARERCS